MAEKVEIKIPELIYTDLKGRQFYRAEWHPDKLPLFHRRLMQFHLAYLFLLPTIAITLMHLHYEVAPMFYYVAWLLLTMYTGMTINNYKMPVDKKKAAWMVLSVPVELIIIAFVYQWSVEVELIEWAFTELLGFSFGIAIGAMFRVAPVHIVHRVFSAGCFLVLGALLLSGFSAFLITVYADNAITKRLLLLIPYLQSIYNYVQLMTRSEMGGKHDVNMGTSVLMERCTPVVALFVLLWIVGPIILLALD